MDALLTRLADAQETEVPKTLTDAAKAVEDEVKKLRDELESKVDGVSAKLHKVHDIVDVKWTLPQQLNSALEDMRQHLQEATDLLNKRDITDADRIVETIITAEMRGLNDKLASFAQDLAEYMTAAADSPFPADASNTQRLADLSKLASTTATDLVALVNSDSVAQAQLALTKLHQAYQPIQQFARAAGSMATSLCEQALERLKPAFGDKVDAPFEKVHAASVAAAEQFTAGLSDPGTAKFSLTTDAVKLAWTELLAGLQPLTDKTKLKDAIDHAQWLGAVQLAIEAEALGSGSPPDGLKTISLHGAKLGEQTGKGETTVPVVPPPGPLGMKLTIDPAQLIEKQSKDRRKFLAQGRTAAAVQSFCVGAIFAVGTYFLYGETWVGTGKEMLTLFLLAFGLDLTSDTMLAALKKTQP